MENFYLWVFLSDRCFWFVYSVSVRFFKDLGLFILYEVWEFKDKEK